MQNKSLWQAYKALHPRTRVWIGVGKVHNRTRTQFLLHSLIPELLLLSLGGMIVATVGMGLSDYLEKTYPATEREREQAELLSPVTVVDRHPDNKNA